MNLTLRHIVEFFIFAEFIIVILLVIMTYVTRLYFSYHAYMNKKRTLAINDALTTIQTNQVIEPLPYSNYTHLIINIFFEWDSSHDGSIVWNRNKQILMKEQILPYAAKYINSYNWTKRFWLLQCFEYYIDANYEAIVIKLINDKYSIISLGTTRVAMQFSTKPIIDALINKISRSYSQFQKLYISQLKPNHMLYEVIREKLMTSSDPQLRKLCYKALKQIGVTEQFYIFALHDISANNLELKLDAIRVLADANPKAATPILIKLLKSKNWLVRNTTIQNMGRLNKEEIIKHIALALYDEAWWVRVNAAKILATFGEDGRTMLEISAKTHNLETFQEPMYFLKIHNLREH